MKGMMALFAAAMFLAGFGIAGTANAAATAIAPGHARISVDSGSTGSGGGGTCPPCGGHCNNHGGSSGSGGGSM